MFFLFQEEWAWLLGLAEKAWPREICGLLFVADGQRPVLRPRPTSGQANTASSFHIADSEIDFETRRAELAGQRLVGCFHSHSRGPALPSRRDRRGAAASGGLWLICAPARGEAGLFDWTGRAFRRVELRLLRETPGT